jgi:hypothetical protein
MYAVRVSPGFCRFHDRRQPAREGHAVAADAQVG